jgi:hypothetical protein
MTIDPILSQYFACIVQQLASLSFSLCPFLLFSYKLSTPWHIFRPRFRVYCRIRDFTVEGTGIKVQDRLLSP